MDRRTEQQTLSAALTRRSILRLWGLAPVVLIACGPGSSATTPTATVPATTATTAAASQSPAATATSATASSASLTVTTTAATSSPTTATVATPPATGSPVARASATPIAAPACVLRPQQTEGPYFVDEHLNRADIRTDPATGKTSPGVPLSLTFRILQVAPSGCVPLANALVDIWQCDALGVYSDVRGSPTAGQKFLRGYQVTDGAGAATFTTIYPGWYQGRTVHIHFKVRTDPVGNVGLEFTSQLYFDDALSDQIFTQPPYSSRGARSTRNASDGVYRNGGDQLLLQPARRDDGYTATFDIGIEAT